MVILYMMCTVAGRIKYKLSNVNNFLNDSKIASFKSVHLVLFMKVLASKLGVILQRDLPSHVHANCPLSI